MHQPDLNLFKNTKYQQISTNGVFSLSFSLLGIKKLTFKKKTDFRTQLKLGRIQEIKKYLTISLQSEEIIPTSEAPTLTNKE